MSMELLAAPSLSIDHGGFYTPPQAARARVEHLERSLLFWPYMAVVDAFQHWVYEHATAASQPASCDAAWADLWQRFMPGVDWGGLDQEMRTGWQRKIHIHTDPFYYIEYGLAQLGATQVWHNALSDQAGAVAAYRQALARSYFHLARNYYDLDHSRYVVLLRKVRALDDQFRPQESPVCNLAWRLLGFRTTEWLAARKRRAESGRSSGG